MERDTAIICFTHNGAMTARRIRQALPPAWGSVRIWCKKKDFQPEEAEGIQPLEAPLRSWTRDRFRDCGRIVFVSATGIAVRAIAPYLQSKTKDPAVLSVDEQGKFVISLVSGHIGGANEDALLIARGIGAVPVITTATDLNGMFAVDVFARRNGLRISSMALAKEVSARLLDGETLDLSSCLEAEGEIPAQLRVRYAPEESLPGGVPGKADIRVTIALPGQEHVLHLIPPIVTVGMGCRKGKSAGALRQFLEETLREAQVDPAAVEQICSVDLKARETGLQELAGELGVPFRVFDAETLAACQGDFTPSAFVQRTAGVDNVCERSAVCGSRQGTLIIRKHARDGMTIAAAVRKGRIRFE